MLLVLLWEVNIGRFWMYGDRLGIDIVEDAAEVSLSLEPGLWLCFDEERMRSGDLEDEGRAGDHMAGLRCTVVSIVLNV